MQISVGKGFHVGLVDGKEIRYQLLIGLSVIMMVHHVVDTIMFRISTVCKDLWHVNNFESDIIVIILASPDKVGKISNLVGKCQGKVLLFVPCCIFTGQNILCELQYYRLLWEHYLYLVSYYLYNIVHLPFWFWIQLCHNGCHGAQYCYCGYCICLLVGMWWHF